MYLFWEQQYRVKKSWVCHISYLPPGSFDISFLISELFLQLTPAVLIFGGLPLGLWFLGVHFHFPLNQ